MPISVCNLCPLSMPARAFCVQAMPSPRVSQSFPCASPSLYASQKELSKCYVKSCPMCASKSFLCASPASPRVIQSFLCASFPSVQASQSFYVLVLPCHVLCQPELCVCKPCPAVCLSQTEPLVCKPGPLSVPAGVSVCKPYTLSIKLQ